MVKPSHQTVRLAPGAHEGPEDGACVVELASMLADVPFSDRPQTVCPALREFLHGYNDTLPDELRQDMYGLASAIVGTRAPALTTAWRARLCTGWGRSLAAIEGVSIPFSERTLTDCALSGRGCAELAHRDGWFHRQTLAFMRWLSSARRPGTLGPQRLAPATPMPVATSEPAPVLGQAHRFAPVARVELLHH